MAESAEKLKGYLGRAMAERTVLVCGKHFYSPGGAKMPTPDCPDCWFAFLFHHIAKLPPDLRREKLEEMEMVIRQGAEAEDRGELDFKPLPGGPKIESIEKEKE